MNIAFNIVTAGVALGTSLAALDANPFVAGVLAMLGVSMIVEVSYMLTLKTRTKRAIQDVAQLIRAELERDPDVEFEFGADGKMNIRRRRLSQSDSR